MDIIVKIAQLLLSLSILVLLHEFGHFISAKLFKTKVEKFYLFFDPWFHLFKFKKGDTEYGIGWLPLGGYCKIAGMIDESMDKEQLKQPPQPWEFRSKKTWQRLIIMLGGVTMNVILAVGIYITMLTYWGEEYLPTANVSNGISVDSVGRQIGLMSGDKILSVDHHFIEEFKDVPVYIILNQAKSIQIIRDNKNMDITVPENITSKIIKSNSGDFISIRFPFEIADFARSSPAKKAGLLKGDKIIGIIADGSFDKSKIVNRDTLNKSKIVNRKSKIYIWTPYFSDFHEQILKYKDQIVTIIALRKNDTIRKELQVTKKGLIGVAPKSLDNYFTFKKKDYTFLAAIPAGTIKTYKMIGDYLKQLKLIFSPETKAYESLGGFIAIGNIFPGVWDWESFWRLTAFLSVMLAIMNVLPIPALDGGHVLFLIYEILTGRKPSDKFLEYAQITGMVILLSLLVYANGNDIMRLFQK